MAKTPAKPKQAKLKVFRTPIGFHDAYVAAPSRKAALEAWGSDKDLFARGAAEEVTDPALTAEPLARPGAVIKLLRGTAAEQIAALPPDPPRPDKARSDKGTKGKKAAVTPEAKPKPSRAKLEAAERALAEAVADHDAAMRALAAREAELARERRKTEQAHASALDRLSRVRDEAAAEYQRALHAWRD